ncbi:MAG: VOC family protein [Pseudorhodoplanes sp.]
MTFKLHHLHLKSPDPKKTAEFYIGLGGTITEDIPGRGLRMDFHGLQLNITTHVAEQKRKQSYGVEHFAVTADDIDKERDRLVAEGATYLESIQGKDLRAHFLQGPDGVQLELIGK